MFEAVDYPHDSPTTGGLGRLRGDGWSAFVKLIQAPRHWARWPTLPPASRDTLVMATARWRQEADLYRSDLAQVMPSGMRLPAVRGVVDLGDDRLLLVLEDVAVDDSPWDEARFAAAARRLGRLQARMTAHGPFLPVDQQPAELMTQIHQSRLMAVVLPALAADATWAHPLLVGERALRSDLAELAGRLPAVIAAAATLPQLQAHGDATPHNLLVADDEPDMLVVIDWGMANLGPIGDDLGQLLVGLAHDGTLDVDDLPSLHQVLVGAYAGGLADEGCDATTELVLAGMNAGLAVRSALTALPLERLGEPLTDELADHIDHRLALTRYLVEVGFSAPGAAAPRGRARRSVPA